MKKIISEYMKKILICYIITFVMQVGMYIIKHHEFGLPELFWVPYVVYTIIFALTMYFECTDTDE